MKLAEALSGRADIKARILQLRSRLKNNAKVLEGDEPAEDPYELLAELNRNVPLYEELIVKINLTNSKTITADGITLTAMLAKRDALSMKAELLREFLANASCKTDRYSKTEIRVLSTVNVRELQKEVDALSKELRQLDMKIQELNWTVDLIE